MLGFAVSVAFITYLDRVCISAAAPSMQRELGLSVSQMGYVFSIFALAYGVFEIPMGWFGDRYGQRRLLARIVSCWSVFTILTGLVRGYASLLTTRFVFGAAEAGAFPTLSRALARWFPQSERGRTSGIMWMGARLGGSVAPPLAALLIARVGWRETFIIFGAVGLVWTALFWRWYRDSPADHPSVNQAELDYIQSGRTTDEAAPQALPYGKLFGNRNLWALFGMYFCSAYGFFFFVTWLPTYLIQEHGLTLERSGWYSAFPLAAGAVACLVGGSVSDWLVRRLGSLKWGRRIIGIAGFALAGLGFAAATQANSGLAAVLWLAFAQGAQDLTLPVAWATCIDVSHKYGGTATGFMNTASSISAMISPVSAAWLATTFGSFHSMFFVASVVYCVGALFWGLIDAEQLVED